MRTQISTFILATCCFVSVCCSAQDEQENYKTVTPKWVSEKGYWTIESNVKTPDNSIVYFYNNDNVLVYKEQVTGVKINLKRRKVLMNLKRVLEHSIIAWENKHTPIENQMWVAIALKK